MQSKYTEALKQALTELSWYEEAGLGRISSCDAIHTIREALEEPQQEPVAWMTKDGEIYEHECWPEYEARPLVFGDTSPSAQRKPLTNEEIEEITPKGAVWKYEIGFTEAISFVRAIEAAHQIGVNK